ncbi:OmpA family protein [Fulvivirgaceae bacterium PWU5]|uniref:OmpA family protein n=1 Tax=Dawidia cretensis TaxID=2782350 RepID=A0AAP2DVC2_9BACT|nr:OmpA family protein [Dawidia cretensis]MBT1706923.1 OmpA family protein [Dawidia cretensis]
MAPLHIKLFLVLYSVAIMTFGQTADSVIQAEGKIYNAETNEPVNARISYQSLPYGNRLGTLNGTSFSFPMFDNEKYAITVEARGFAVAKYMLDPAQANGDRKVLQDVPLTSSSGTTSKHTVGQVMRLNNLIFQVSKSKIDPGSYPELDVVVNMMKENTSMIIQLEGHTDYQGNANDNMRLSQLRVAAVKNYIVSKKIAKNRIKTKAFGGTQPLSREDTPEAHRINRRVELRILEN